MLHSGYSAAAQGRCRLRQDAGAVPRSEYGRWPDSQPARSEPEIPGSVDSQVTGSQRSNEYKGGFSGELYINEMDKLAKDTQTGNCSQLSAVMFNYLKLRGVRPIDYFGIFRGGWNHAFVVLNRDATTPIPDFAKGSEIRRSLRSALRPLG